MSLQSKLQDKEWTFVPPNESQVLMINVFDDGNERFEQYENEWILFGTWMGKIALYNKNQSSIILQSISKWKTINK
jgi:hypothetical protein